MQQIIHIVNLPTDGYMSFSFSMQKILDYRALLEDEAKVQLGKAQAMLKQEEEHFAHIEAQIAATENEIYKDMTMDASCRWLLESFIKGLRSDLAQSHARLLQLHESVKNCKEMLLIRSKDKKVLEKLKEKQQERHYAEEKDLERKINDESATLRFNMVPL